MSEKEPELTNSEPSAHTAAEPPQPAHRVRINRARMTTTYANGFFPINTAETLFLDFGASTSPESSGTVSEPATVNVGVDTRVAMTFQTAKKLAIVLGNILNSYERTHGEITQRANNSAAGNASSNTHVRFPNAGDSLI
ncbi:MAG: DUF3467 domain-containing protein [Pseudomonadota bacterium]